ncbi:MAG: serine O-acetyltransferase [Pseudomonadota bacterium]
MTYAENLVIDDPLWSTTREEAWQQSKTEPLLASFLHTAVLNHTTLEQSLSFNLATKLAGAVLPDMSIRALIDEVLAKSPSIGEAVRADLQAVRERDPACKDYLTPLLYFKGFQALQAHRISHFLWQDERQAIALYLQSRISEVFAVDIHPAARIGKGLLIDHATSLVIGETAVVDDDVSILHEVTLGGTGKEGGDRHPKIRSGVLIGSGAKILGNIEVGHCARIASGSVVLENVPPCATVAGVPAKIVRQGTEGTHPAKDMDHSGCLCEHAVHL